LTKFARIFNSFYSSDISSLLSQHYTRLPTTRKTKSGADLPAPSGATKLQAKELSRSGSYMLRCVAQCEFFP